MARRSQCSDAGDNPHDLNYLPPHYREEYRMAIDALIEEDVEGYYKFLQFVDVVDFLAPSEIDYIQNCVQIPKQSTHPEHRYLDTTGDGSSDTYWPMHSDLDAPGLDLGWPQIHHFIGPTEVTTLVNPAAPDMPSIKEQARRLIKNAQMVIAVVMDMFTDVDIFADILNATTRNVAVYLLLDEANVQYFINMVNNCRVNLQAIQFLRVRTVTGIRYHCRTGKSFKGQMLDRFILTDCRAVLSGNYSFMWSYEKLHRCMAHLFLGQMVSTFDEEFRILFAQSEPLDLKRMEDMTVLPSRPCPGDRPMLRDPRKYRTMDPGQPEEWNRPPYEENMDWRMGPLKRHDTFQGPMDMYNRYPSPQSVQTRLEPPFDQGPPRMMEALAHKRHGFAEGGPGRYNLPYQQPQPGLPEVEPPGRPFYRGQQHLHPGHDPDYGSYGSMDKFWNQDFQQEEPYPEPGYPREIDPHENFDPVLNYLSSARNVEMEQSSDKLIPSPDLPYATTHPRRHIGQPYACQTSPTPSNTTEKRFMQDHSSDRKDPTVKRGLRNWRISSYLSAYDSSGEPEGLPMGHGQVVDPFDDMPHPMQQPTPPPPQAIELAVPKIPNVREFKVPALPRASQMPAFAKTTPKDLPKRFPDEIPQIIVPPIVQELKAPTPTPSESSSTTDGEKQEEVEIREPIASVLRRDDSFRGKYNAAMQRGSRLRSSLIFRSLDQSTQDNSDQDEDKAKTEADQTKLAFVSRRPGAREPFEWRSYIKSSDNAKTEDDSGKQAEKDSESKSENLPESQELAKTKEVAQSPQLAPKVDAVESAASPKIEQPPPQPIQQPPSSLLSELFLDMNDPDQRFLFFKELAAKRKAEKAAEEVKLKQKNVTKEKKEELKKEGKMQEEVVGSSSETTKEDSKKIDAKMLDMSSKIENVDSGIKKEPMQSCDKIETKIATDLEKTELKQSQACKPESTEKLTQEKEASKEIDATKPAEKQDQAKEANVASKTANADQVTEEKQPPTNTTDTTSKDPQLKNSTSVPDFAKTFGLDLFSSLPSARISEQSLSQEANKEATPKSRLWSPTIQRREFLKPFGDKQKSISTVIQIEEATEEGSDVASDASKSQGKAKSEIDDKTATKQSAQTILENKQEMLEKTDSSSTENTKDAKEASPSNSVTSVVTESTTVLPVIAENQKQLNKGESIKLESESKEGAIEKSLTSIQSPINEESVEKSSTRSTQIKKDTTDVTSAAKWKTELSNKEPIKEALVKFSGTGIKDSKRSMSPFERLMQDNSKTEQKQPIESGKENSSVEQADSAQKSDKLQATVLKGELQPQQKMEEKSNIEDQNTKVTGPNEVVKIIEKPGESLSTSEKVSPAKSSEDTVTTSSSTFPSDKTVQETSATVDESKQKYPTFEEVALLESHSNTSSPVSFATAIEFISSEDSDFLSPDKNDPQNLFKTSQLESSVSDLSDFETPNSEISMSPMPATVDMDDTFEDNASIAETVIEAPKRKAATAQEVKDGSENISQKQASQDISKSSENEKMADSAKSEKQVEGTTQIAAVESSTSVATSKVDETKMADKASEMSTESSTKDVSNIQSETSKESISTEVKTQDLTSQSETNAGLNKDIVVSPGTSEEKEETKMEEKPAEITVKDTSKSLEASKESRIDDKSLDPKISVIEIEDETCSTNQSRTNPVSNVTSESLKLETNTKKVYSRFQVEPSNASAETNANMVTSKVTEKVKIADTTSEFKSDSTIETSLESKIEGIGQNLEASEAKQAASNENKVEPQDSTTTQEAKTVEKTTEIITKEPSTAEENIVLEKVDSKTVTPSNTNDVNQSPTCPTICQVKEPETCKPAEMTNNDNKQDNKNETAPKDEKIESKTEILSSTSKTNQSTTSSTTSEMTINANSDKETPSVNKEMSKSAGGENEQKSKDANDNTKENTSTSDSAKVIETAPPTAQPKQQQKSRYLSSTANVISSSNLRDDTKILLEQISANSQTRNESNPAKEAPVTDEEKEDEADKNGKCKNDLRSSMGQQKTSQERDKLLERIQTMRKDRKVYSRFEV
ncbi:protein FAM83H isoform X2 [Periophthalmus magnuspinnatus]|nr:protein FAM83H isoform X2 [Periophthalmus magnuspinnatus]